MATITTRDNNTWQRYLVKNYQRITKMIALKIEDIHILRLAFWQDTQVYQYSTVLAF